MNIKGIIFLISLYALLAESLNAYDMKKCIGYQTKDALLRKYDFKYIAPSTHPSDSANISVPTKTTSKEGLTKTSSQSSIQSSTMMLDPSVTTKGSTGSSQFYSSWGPCSMIGYELKEKRDSYIANNFKAIQKEIAIGSGEHVTALAKLSGCQESAFGDYVDTLRKNYDPRLDSLAFSSHLSSLVGNSPELRRQCVIF